MVSEPVWFDPLTNFVALLLGAAISYGTTSAFEKRREARENKALAFALIFSIQKICNDLIQLNNGLRQLSNDRDEELANGVALWQIMPMHFGWDESVSISPSELALLAGTKKHEWVTRVQEAQSAHRIYTSAATRINELKSQLMSSGLATESEGAVVRFEATAEQFASLAPILEQLNVLAERLGDDLAEATLQAVRCGKAVPKLLKDHYKFDHLVGLTFGDYEDEVAEAERAADETP